MRRGSDGGLASAQCRANVCDVGPALCSRWPRVRRVLGTDCDAVPTCPSACRLATAARNKLIRWLPIGRAGNHHNATCIMNMLSLTPHCRGRMHAGPPCAAQLPESSKPPMYRPQDNHSRFTFVISRLTQPLRYITRRIKRVLVVEYSLRYLKKTHCNSRLFQFVSDHVTKSTGYDEIVVSSRISCPPTNHDRMKSSGEFSGQVEAT